MKKLITLLSFAAISISILSQVPEKMSYQAVVRNSAGELIKNSPVGMKISILQGTSTGAAVYIETHTLSTNINGLATIEIGGGTPISGTMAGIDWSEGLYFLKTESDPSGGNNYTITGTSQLLSVPYSLYSKYAENAADLSYVDELKRRLEEMEDIVASQLHPPSDGLVAYYPFNGNAEDESGNENHGTIVNAIPVVDRLGSFDCAFRFDGNSGTERYIYSHIGKHSTLSVSVWFKSGTPSTMYPNIFTYGSLNRLDAGLLGNHPDYIAQNKTGIFGAGAVTGPSFVASVNSTQKYIDDTWHHAVVMFVPNDKIYLYIDNSLVAETPYTSNNPSDDLFYVGRQIQDDAGSVLHQTHFNGTIDDIRIYDRKLTGAEISILYNEDGYPKSLVTDMDGNKYNTVQIGNQVWMVENLKTTKYSNGDQIPNCTNNGQWPILTTGAWRFYNDDIQYNTPFGKLYNWPAVSDPRNICPTGWHVPSDDEWKILELFLGMSPTELDLTYFRGTSANIGGMMKTIDSEHWSDPNTGATNESGFSGTAGGRYNHDGTFIFLHLEGTWWSSTLATPGTNIAWLRILSYGNNGICRGYPTGHMTGGGFSVRCLKD